MALNRCFSYVSVIQVSEPDYGILSLIQHLWKHSPIDWKVRHVKGHQDDLKSSDDIDRGGKLNIEMDSLAKSHITYAKTCQRHFMLSHEPWSVWRNGGKIIKKLEQTLYEVVHAPLAKKYWTSRGKISNNTFHQVNWEVIDHAMSHVAYSAPFCLQEVIEQQKSMGWNLMLEGWLAAKWELEQQAYYTLIKSRQSWNRWLIAIIKKLWQVAWDLWDHRNKVLHEKENTVMQSHQHQLDRLVTATYQHLSTYVIDCSDQYLTRLAITQLLTKDYEYKNVWLIQANAALCITRRSHWSQCIS
jgi:hypothetical protein